MQQGIVIGNSAIPLATHSPPIRPFIRPSLVDGFLADTQGNGLPNAVAELSESASLATLLPERAGI